MHIRFIEKPDEPTSWGWWAPHTSRTSTGTSHASRCSPTAGVHKRGSTSATTLKLRLCRLLHFDIFTIKGLWHKGWKSESQLYQSDLHIMRICLKSVPYLSVHLSGRILRITWTFKGNKSKASWLVCLMVLHQNNWSWREMSSCILRPNFLYMFFC